MLGEILSGLGIAASGIGSLGNLYQANQNFQLQRENLDYQKALQQTIFNREDTALQRKMKDAEAAGLNPYSVINQGGANAGSVVKTEAPQMNFNMNGMMDAINSYLSMQQNYQNTLAAKTDAENKVKSGLILDADLTQKNWQNKILGNELDLSYLNKNNLFLDSLRNQADFNYNFDTNWQFDYSKLDNGIDGTYYYWDIKDKNSGKGPIFGKEAGTPFYDRNWFLDKDVEYNNANLFYDKMLNNNWYMNYGYNAQKNQADMIQFQRDLMDKNNAWYNFNQGFDKVTGVIDSISGLLFKGLDFGLRKANAANQWNLNASSAYKNYAQGYHYYYGKN